MSGDGAFPARRGLLQLVQVKRWQNEEVGFLGAMHAFRHCGLVAAILLLAGGCSRASDANVPALTPADAAARVKAGTSVLIDVREQSEWRSTGVVTTAHLLALSDLRGSREQWSTFLESHREKELIIYCRTGNRSGQAAKVLAAEGFRVANAGGLSDWVNAGQALRAADEPPQFPTVPEVTPDLDVSPN